MKITLEITTRQEKILKKIYGEQSLNVLFQLWFNEWIEKRVDKIYIPSRTLNQKIDELTK